ncbi:MAG: glycosyltransferase [Limisphaerales bacterium]
MKPLPHRRLGLLTPPISGHLNPALSVARELRDRGYHMTYFGLPDARTRVLAAGIEFHPLCQSTHPEGTVPAWMKRQGELTGLAAMRWILRCLQSENLGVMRDLPDALHATGTDALLTDQLSYGAASVAQHQGLPYVTLCNALPVHRDDSVPPFATSWAPVARPLEALRSFLGFLPLRPLFHLHLAPINSLRRSWGLKALRPESLADSPRAILSQQPPTFEFARRRLPARFHLTGPWQRPDTRPEEPFPFERLDGRPLIYASLGTLQNRIESIFRIIAEACAPLDAQLVIALGARDAVPPPKLPGDPVVVPFAPQMKLLRIASLVITHAGLNTALEALAHGVPSVAIPITNDQPGVAARLRACGAGEFIPVARLNPSRLRRVVEQVLHTPSYRQAALRFAESITREDGIRKAADLIEASLEPQVSSGCGEGQPAPVSACRIAA